MAPGELTVGQTLVDEDTEVLWKGTSFKLGVEKVLSFVSDTANQCFDNCLRAAINYAGEAARECPSLFPKNPVYFNHGFNDEFNATGICPASNLIGVEGNISGYLV